MSIPTIEKNKYLCYTYSETEVKQMRINIKCSSAVHILLMIELLKDKHKLTSEFLAASLGNNPVEVRKLLSNLKKAEIIKVARGPGGASLLKEPKNITLLEICNAVDPKSLENLIGIHSHPSQECPFGKNITNLLAGSYTEISKTVRDKMNSITLEQLSKQLKEMEPNFFSQL